MILYRIKRRAISAVALSACAFCFPALAADGLWSRSYEPENTFRNLKHAQDRFTDAETKASTNPSQDNIDAFMRSGFVLSDVSCEAWMGTLGRIERNANFYKDMLNIVGNLILGISGINGANPSSLARGSLGLAAANATVEAVKDEIIMGVISDIEGKVREGRKVTAATMKLSPPPFLDDARVMLLDYHRECSPNAIKVLLKTSLSNSKFTPPDTTLGAAKDQASSDLLAATLAADIFGADSEQTLSDKTLYKLYVTQVLAPDDKSAWIESMRADVKGFAESFNRDNKDKHRDALIGIAELRGYDQRYSVARAAELASQAKIAAKESDDAKAAAAAAEASRKKLPDSAFTGLTARSKNTFSLALSGGADLPALDAAKSDADKIAATRGDSTAIVFQEKATIAAARARIAAKANDELARTLATPIPQPRVGVLKATRMARPASFNAVLVPITP